MSYSIVRAALLIASLISVACTTTPKPTGVIAIKNATSSQTVSLDKALRPFLERYDYIATVRHGEDREFVAHYPPFGLTPVPHHWQRPNRILLKHRASGLLEVTCEGVDDFRATDNEVVNDLKNALATVFRPEQLKPIRQR